jgi:hypothetical protein
MTEKDRKETLRLKLTPGMRALEYAIVEKFQLSYMSDTFKLSWLDLCKIINEVKEDPDSYYHERDPYLSDEARSFFDKYCESKKK